jgi:ribosome-associated toxin RatA of RatAB toxin-antitoxin module
MTTRVLITTAVMLATAPGVPVAQSEDLAISVLEVGDAHVVTARFSVSASPAAVRNVLTDYANIPRFMPDVRTSRVLERRDGHARVEQELVSTYLFFSKRIHLVLDIEEGTDSIHFRDCSNTSFVQYEGAWHVNANGEQTEIGYELTAQPDFRVPGFVLRGLLNRDASVMIDRLRAEIHARALSP